MQASEHQIYSLGQKLRSANERQSIFGQVFKKNLSFKIAMSGRADRQASGGRASSEIYLLVNRFSKFYVTFIL